MWSWWQRRRREQALTRHAIPEADWQRALSMLPFLAHYQPDLLARLRELTTLFLIEKSIVSGAEAAPWCLEVTPFMRVLVATEACVLLMGRPEPPSQAIEYFAGFENVVIHPEDFPRTYDYEDEDGIVHRLHEPISGESWEGGPVLLAWPAVEAGYDETGMALVIHEFAHKLDMLDGAVDGMPPLTGAARQAFATAIGEAYTDFRARVEAGEETAIDPYAAEAIEEFFAVSCEVFFAEPELLARAYPLYYAELEGWFGLDPRRGVLIRPLVSA